MPKPIRMSRRVWVAAWAVLCAAGLVATVELSASSAPDPRPAKPVSTECAKYIADIEVQLAKAEKEGKRGGVVAISRIRGGAERDCREELSDHFGGDG